LLIISSEALVLTRQVPLFLSIEIIYTIMNRILLLAVSMLLLSNTLFAQFTQTPSTQPEKHEFRSVWLTTAFGLDWPKTTNVQDQQASLRLIIERMAGMKMNAVVFQAVSRGDAQYRSTRLPWATRLTGTPGGDPGWDPLQFVIDEAAKYGMEVHAWVNIFNIGVESDIPAYQAVEPRHIYATNPEWVGNFSGSLYLNPGIPGARQWAIDNVMEIVNNYDVDAVHFDFARYGSTSFPNDFDNRALYTPNYTGNISDWRRDNINAFQRGAYEAIQEVKPWVKVGTTPFGHYQNSSWPQPHDVNCPYFGTTTPCSWAAALSYSQTYQDSPRWLNEGINDYLAPQLYWSIGAPGPHFEFLVKDWQRLGATSNRHIYPGIGAYVEAVIPQISAQVDTIRTHNHAGHIFFRYDNIYGMSGPPTFALAPRINYGARAMVPAMNWKDTDVPNAPLAVQATRNSAQVTISWTAPEFQTASGDTKLSYVIYRVRGETPPPASEVISNPANILALTASTSYTDTPANITDNYYYYVAAYSRNWVEGSPAEPIEVITPTSVENGGYIARTYALDQNYPNPFNPTTTIRYEIAEAGHVRLDVFDLTGRLVSTIENSARPAGVHTAIFNAGSLASGVYVYQLTANNVRLTGRMTLLK
jgi:uncharacterized lipoprotein YddW (UPF0748 family)